MKKIFLGLIVFMTTIALVGCGEKTLPRNLPVISATDTREQITEKLEKRNINFYFENISTEDESLDGQFYQYGAGLIPGDLIEEQRQVVVYMHKFVLREIMISKYLQFNEGHGANNMAIELYNPTDKTVDLSNYRVAIYFDGSNRAGKTIRLTGTLTSQSTYTIVNPESDNSLEETADLITNDLQFNGDEAIAILNKDNMVLDLLGFKGQSLMTLNNKVIVRRESVRKGVENYNPAEWDIYDRGANSIIINKEFPIATPTNFTYLEEDFNTQYTTIRGMVKVKFVSNNDGDTAQFKVIDGQLEEDFFMGGGRLRFLGINTREMSSPVGSKDYELALAATNYVHDLLSSAKDIYIQHDPAGRVDNYARNLGLIWADGQLVNYLVVLEGHSVSAYSDTEPRFIYESMTLENWFRAAEASAKQAKKGIWAE